MLTVDQARYTSAYEGLSTKFAALATIFVASSELSAQNWPQWRGPSGHGVSPETGLPTSWSPSQNLAWRVSLAGLGTSSPIVWGDRVIVTSQVGRSAPAGGAAHPQLARDDRELAEREHPIGGRRLEAEGTTSDVWLVVEAFARSNGRRLWEYRTKATGTLPDVHEKHNLATPTPVTDGERVYAWFGNGQIVALDMEGRVVWTRHLGVEVAPFRTLWGHGSSPVLFDDLLILLCDHLSDAYLLAVDARHWKGSMEGRSRQGSHLAQYAARRARRRGCRTSRQFIRAHRRLRSGDGEAVVVHRQTATDADSVGRLP